MDFPNPLNWCGEAEMCLGMANVTGENEAASPILSSVLNLSMAGGAESDPMKVEGLCSNSVWYSTGEIKLGRPENDGL
jgi:hypothetical protein